MLTVGSLFSGIGGLELGLERAGLGPVRWQVEIDPFCRAVLAKHWPDAVRYNDVREVGEELEPVDLICGGFPCQDISNAGRRIGIDGERSGLWSEFARIIRLVRPRYVVVENVAALLARGMERVLGDLAACGYDAEWRLLRASDVGAPHKRERVFIMAYANEHALRKQSEPESRRSRTLLAGLAGEGVADSNGQRESQPQRSIADERRRVGDCCAEGLADSNSDGREERRTEQDERQRRPDPMVDLVWPPAPNDLLAWRSVQADAQPSVCRVAHGIPNRVDRLRSLGNAVVPQCTEVIGRRIMEMV